MNKKSQSAMEYLMTYGWAILVVLIALGALFYLGVFSPSMPSSCNAPSPLTCTDILADSSASTITFVMATTGTSDADVTALTIDTPTGKSCTIPGSTDISSATPTSLIWTLCDLGTNEGDKLSGTLTTTYQLQGSDIVHTTQVQFSGVVEA